MNHASLPRSNRPGRRGALQALAAASVLVGAGLLWQGTAVSAARGSTRLPPPAQDLPASSSGLQKAVFAGGCFWGVQGVFQHIKGVKQAVSGYSGGASGTASYKQVSNGGTGHAESVEVTYDPAQISYGTLLQVFFSVAHDPTELDRQGPDVGSQYRSAIFATNPAQLKAAQAYVAQLGAAHAFSSPIVTRISDSSGFYRAEDYHQDFLAEHPRYPYIVYNDLPKLVQLKRLFPEIYREEPVLVKQAQ